LPLLHHAKDWLHRIAGRKRKLPRRAAETLRLRGFELMEPRQLLSAAPLYVGAVYIEEDTGSDVSPDTFELTFVGGAAGTELTRVEINTDQNMPGLGGGDLIFDTVQGGLGADLAHPFVLVALQTADSQATVRATVEDGGSLLILELSGFRAGDKLIFTIDVDEVVRFNPSKTDIAAINDGIDPITSGIEFQGTRLNATFVAPHYHEVQATAEFFDRYDTRLTGSQLNLPADDYLGKRSRTAGAVAQTQQQPLPVSVSGKVYLDSNLDLRQDANELGLANVALTLWRREGGEYRFTGHTTLTDAQGRYAFGTGLNLLPGMYQIRETQPDGLFSVGAVPGTVAGRPTGQTVADNRDLLTDIAIPLGGTHAVDFDFAEAAPAQISGYVYHDRNNDGRRRAGEEGLSNVQIVVSAVDTISPQTPLTVTTDSSGYYVVRGLAPGVYRVVQPLQPAGYLDGLDAVGTVAGEVRGRAINPGDTLNNIFLGGGQAGIEYNFGELVPVSIQGQVCVADRFGDCDVTASARVPLPDATVRLMDRTGQLLAETKTDADGRYRFTGLFPGTYAVAEITPDGLIDGGEQIGTVAGRQVGRRIADGTIGEITLASGQQAIDYDFCEYLPARLSGYVYHDRNNNGLRESGEEGLVGVGLRLLDEAGQQVAAATTNALGYYEFVFLHAGVYAVVQTQPAGWIDGRDRAGTVGGQTVGRADEPGDRIGEVVLWWGDEGVNYNFGEFLLASIRGSTHLTGPDGDCYTPGGPQRPLAGVLVRLLDNSGAQVAETRSDAQGNYRFDGLLPGTYTVVEQTPPGLIDGPERVGTVAGRPMGTVSANDTISGIALTSGQTAVDYDFCEHAPASLSGVVYHDRNNNGRRDPGEEPLAGVTMRLLDEGRQVLATRQTGTDGVYEFRDLRAGQYAVAESQPAGYLDGLDAPGTVAGATVGVAVNPGDEIREIHLRWGDAGQDYDFGELLSGSIAGLVFADLDLDCRFDPGEQPLAGVTVDLLDRSGRVLASMQTDSQGKYRFADLAPGRYTVREHQPAGYFQGGQRAGSGGGNASLEDIISDIAVGSGQHLTDYNFCEVPPGSLTGIVHLDLNENGRWDAGEQTLAGVAIRLLDSNGQVLAETVTNASGRYRFEQLRPGQYAVQETQPSGYFHGGQRAGSHGGDVSVDDMISAISIRPGQVLTDYDFYELPPSRLTGIVHLDPNQNGRWDAGEQLLSGVAIRLLDATGRVVAETATDALGRYRFEQLRPGEYAVQETQPSGYFHGGQRAGSHGGDASVADRIGAIRVPAGDVLDDYDFFELPAAQLSGYVFQDGEQIRTIDGVFSDQDGRVWAKHDGRKSPGDAPLANVVLELRDARTGLLVTSDQALPGTYQSGVITALTDADGYYEFTGLPPGLYDVTQIQPPGYVDGLDTPGTTGGVAFNPNSTVDPQLRVGRSHYPQWDAIVSIPLTAGAVSQGNNFSELSVGRLVVIPPPDPPTYVVPQAAPAPIDIAPPAPPPLIVPPPPANPLRFGSNGTGGMQDYSWHLSVIDAGAPRGKGDPVMQGGLVWRSVTFLDVTDWYAQPLDQGRWTLGTRIGDEGGVRAVREVVFGDADSIPVIGDWNGDGKHDLGVYRQGHFFLDLNGNGRWDDEDLWARLGDELDFPVSGDWNGDGKDDIGIFGPAWPGDPQALEVESGLPDMRNRTPPMPKPKNVPPQPQEATNGLRLLRRTVVGTTRADVIDHVFRYGAGAQIPVTGDWSGDGIKNIGVFRDGQWRLDADGDGRWSENDRVFQFGQPGDLPVVGDFNGDGIDEIGVFRNGMWIVDMNGNHEMDAHDAVFALGGPGDLPVAGDWTGDGVDKPGVYRPGTTAAADGS
jgi:protocatechuate 3,4-dioxygenase beta subunit